MLEQRRSTHTHILSAHNAPFGAKVLHHFHINKARSAPNAVEITLSTGSTHRATIENIAQMCAVTNHHTRFESFCGCHTYWQTCPSQICRQLTWGRPVIMYLRSRLDAYCWSENVIDNDLFCAGVCCTRKMTLDASRESEGCDVTVVHKNYIKNKCEIGWYTSAILVWNDRLVLSQAHLNVQIIPSNGVFCVKTSEKWKYKWL